MGSWGRVRTPRTPPPRARSSSFTKSLAIDFGKQGIRANCIAPGSIATAANAERRKDPRWAEYILEHRLLSRTGEPEDIANAALFLASDESGYVTGITLVVDGGATSTPNWGSCSPPREVSSYTNAWIEG